MSHPRSAAPALAVLLLLTAAGNARVDGQAAPASVEPLIPVDYASGVGTFVPDNAVIAKMRALAIGHQVEGITGGPVVK